MSKPVISAHSPNGTAFDLHGDEGRQVLVLIHGLGLSRRLWDPYLQALGKEYRVLNYDLYGHGESAATPSTASLSLFASQLSELMDHLELKQAAVIGFSIGGMINRRFAMDYPEKTSALAILNSPHDRGEDAQMQVEARASKVREQGAFSTFDDALKRWFTKEYLETGEGPVKVRQWREIAEPESYAQAAWVLANGVRELIKPETPIDCPALVMTCENDTGSTPNMTHDIASEIDGSETLIIPRLQHLGLMEHPELFKAPILNFLERVLK